MKEDGQFLRALLEDAEKIGFPYDSATLNCVRATVRQLMEKSTSAERPGMLLGMIQSGKTRTFLGVIALAADNGFELFLVLTKGTKALTTQTYERLKRAFDTVIELDEARVFDVMTLPKLTLRERRLPMVIVVKKEKRNLERIQRALFVRYPELAARRALIIDDEADYASIGFKRTKNEEIEAQTVMRMIDQVRQSLPNASFLQVTATPYSLYLQPANPAPTDGDAYLPSRPAFTELVPVYAEYIGGRLYFEESLESGSLASFLYRPVDVRELEVLHRPDLRRFKPEEALTSNGVTSLRQAIVTFIVGGLIRRLQAKHSGEKPKKYSFIIHTESSRSAHAWQESVVESIVDKFREATETKSILFNSLVKAAYDDLTNSILAIGAWLPPYEDVLSEVEEYVPAVQIEKVNSEKDVMQLLDRNGQLELRNRLNIFIGGQILDRGLTIANLIGFYYGRRANRFQQDTVLQHSRMYGARPIADLAVTRFYTSPAIYQVLSTVHEFDAGLRQAFQHGGHTAGVVFLRQQGRHIVPCSPNKILVSTLTTLRASKRLLPVGFQTGYKTHIGKVINELDQKIERLAGSDDRDPVLVDLSDAISIIDLISKTLTYEDDSGYEWNVPAFKASIEYVSRINRNTAQVGKVYLLVRRNRENVRIREASNRFFDAPDTAHVEGDIARRYAREAPMLMLFHQKGSKDKGWRDCPFWWPVLYMPTNMGTVVFASDTLEYDEDLDVRGITAAPALTT